MSASLKELSEAIAQVLRRLWLFYLIEFVACFAFGAAFGFATTHGWL
jgi:hypothetical protein